MIYQLTDIRKIWDEPKNSSQIQQSIFYQDRINLHSEITDQKPLENKAFQQFDSWVKNLLPVKKYERFQQLNIFPIATADFVQNIYSKFNKVFYSSDAIKKIKYKNTTNDITVSEFLKEYDDYVKTKGYEAFKTNICSVACVLLDEDETPYIELIPIHSVHDICLKNKCDVDYILYKVSKYQAVFIDSEKYVVLNVDEDGKLKPITDDNIEYHNFDYCPARTFWTSSINNKETLKKVSPISGSLGNLDHLLWNIIGREYTQAQCLFPASWKYPDEDFGENETHETYAFDKPEQYFDSSGENDFIQDNYTVRKSNGLTDKQKGEIWAGTTYIKSIPKGDQVDLGEPIGYISSPTEEIQQITLDIKRREEEIYIKSTGATPDLGNDKAKNEKQIESQFEGEKDKIRLVKQNFEAFEEWMIKTFAIALTDEEPVSITIDYGNKHHFLSTNELLEKFKLLKDSKAPESLLIQSLIDINASKYRNDDSERIRGEKIILAEPYSTKSIEELNGLDIDDVKKELKLNFTEYINMFENEYGRINEAIPQNQLNDKLNEYARGSISTRIGRTEETGQETENGDNGDDRD